MTLITVEAFSRLTATDESKLRAVYLGNPTLFRGKISRLSSCGGMGRAP
jgi:hypothetical protein